MKFTSLAVAIAFGFTGAAFAQETETNEAQTKMKIEDTQEKNKVDGDIDQEITNARMRAESGSKSKWSLSASLQYKGGAISRGFGEMRPNIVGQPGVETVTSLSVDPSVRYRWTKNDSVTIGNSFAIMTPFHGKTANTKQQFNFRDPDVTYNRVGKLGTLQSTGSVSVSAGTSNESRDMENAGSIGGSVSVLKGFENGLTVGVSLAGGYNHYTSKPAQGKHPRSHSDEYGGDARNQFDVGIYPFMEYSFNDRYSFRTVFGYFNWEHLYGDQNKWRLLQTYVYQSVGVGISVTRDIYLYPNVQFVPDNIRGDFTNVAMSATINVF